MKKNSRSNKWGFLIYKESVPENYLEILENIHVPFILSPWHDRDINKETGEILKAHKHGAFFFDSLKSYAQVSELLKRLNAPEHVEILHSARGYYDYLVHAENPDKEQYDIDDIEVGCGFDLERFLIDCFPNDSLIDLFDNIENNNITEFIDLARHVRHNNISSMSLLANKTYFFSKLLDSKRHKKLNDKEPPLSE